MNIKTMICAAALLSSVLVMASDTPEVSNVVMSQSETSRRVTITYELSNAANGAVVTLDIETNKTGTATNVDSDWVSIGGAAICNAHGDVWKKVSQGSKTIAWRPDHSWEGHKVALANGGARAVVTAWALDNTPDYMVVDISAGAQPNTQRYYPAADFLPGGVSNGLYKTTTFLMRKIMAKDVTWTMGSTTLEDQNRNADREGTHQVTLTNNYYIGVYEVTQSQWSQVATNSSVAANFTTERFMRPMEKVSYNEIRNAANETEIAAYNWPSDPNPSSFLGLLRSKTGLDFDLPSEAQWEFAARAGNGSGYWNDGSPILNANPDANLNLLGRYLNNPASNSATNPAKTIAPANGGTAIVGSYAPNSWGLYDMHGNVWEWCLDWCEDGIATATDASGDNYNGRVNIDPSNSANYLSGASASGAGRVKRGGCWRLAAGNCRPAFRDGEPPKTSNHNIGFRILCSAGLR